MTEELHPVVTLLLARMESHPEEFEDASPGAETLSSADRWWKPLDRILDWGSEAEKAAIREGLRKVKLNAAHEMAMDELCNGDERRRKHQEDLEYERTMMQQHQLRAQQQSLQALGLGVSVPSRHPTMNDMEDNGIMNALRKAFK